MLGSPLIELLSLLVVMMPIVLCIVTDLLTDSADCWDAVTAVSFVLFGASCCWKLLEQSDLQYV